MAAAGKQAEVLNILLEDLLEGHAVSETKLKEVLGHTPIQVGIASICHTLKFVLCLLLRCTSSANLPIAAGLHTLNCIPLGMPFSWSLVCHAGVCWSTAWCSCRLVFPHPSYGSPYVNFARQLVTSCPSVSMKVMVLCCT